MELLRRHGHDGHCGRGGEVDVILQIQAVGGEALYNNPDFNVVEAHTATHRQIWMRCDTGQFTDKRARQALGMAIDRPALIETLFKGKADLGNDHVIAPVFPYFDSSVPQRVKDADGAKSCSPMPDSPMASAPSCISVGCRRSRSSRSSSRRRSPTPGSHSNSPARASTRSTERSGAPPNPPTRHVRRGGARDRRLRTSRHARRVPQRGVKTGGVWNSSQYASPEFDAAFAKFQASVGVEAQTVAAKAIEEILLEDTPIVVPYFYYYISAISSKYTGVKVSALGQVFLKRRPRRRDGQVGGIGHDAVRVTPRALSRS